MNREFIKFIKIRQENISDLESAANGYWIRWRGEDVLDAADINFLGRFDEFRRRFSPVDRTEDINYADPAACRESKTAFLWGCNQLMPLVDRDRINYWLRNAQESCFKMTITDLDENYRQGARFVFDPVWFSNVQKFMGGFDKKTGRAVEAAAKMLEELVYRRAIIDKLLGSASIMRVGAGVFADSGASRLAKKITAVEQSWLDRSISLSSQAFAAVDQLTFRRR